MVIRELITRLGFEVDDGKLKSAESKIQKFKKFGMFAGGAIVAAIAGIGVASVKAAADMEMLTTQFEVMLGSTEKANAMMEKLKGFAATTPFALNDLAKGSQQLLSFGVTQDKVIGTMRMLGDTAGGNAEKLNGLILAYGKVTTKGKASLEEINMMAERGLPIFKVLSEQMGVSKEKLFDLISAGKISAANITESFRTMTSEGGLFFKGMEKQSLTFSGLVSTMKDNIKLLLAEVGSTLLPLMKEIVTTITTLVQGPLGTLIKALVEELGPILEVVMGVIESVLTIVGPLVGLLKTVFSVVMKILGVLKVLEPIMKLVGVILKVVDDLIKALMPAINVILDLIIELLNDAVTVLADVLMDFLKELSPLLVSIAEIISTLFPILMPLIRLILKLAVSKLVFQIQAVMLPLQIITKLLAWIFKWMSKFTGWFASLIQKPIQSFWNWINKMIDSFFGKLRAAAEFFGVKLNLPKFSGAMEKSALQDSLKKEAEKGMNINNININNDIQQNIAASGEGAALTTGDMKAAANEATRAAFSLELRKVLVGAT